MKTLMKTEGRHISNQITEGVIWKQLLFFFFPILFGTFFSAALQYDRCGDCGEVCRKGGAGGSGGTCGYAD